MNIITVNSNENLLKFLKSKKVYLPAICGGRGTCGKCAVRVVTGVLPVSDADKVHFSQTELDKGWRLACTAFPSAEISVEIPDTGEQQFSAVSNFEQGKTAGRKWDDEYVLVKSAQSYASQLNGGGGAKLQSAYHNSLSLSELHEVSKLADAQGLLFTGKGNFQAGSGIETAGAGTPADPASGENVFQIYRSRGRIIRIGGRTEPLYGVAVDIGTTTLGLALVDMRSGKIAARHSAVNRQREFGGDVISRIQSANGGNLSALSGSVRSQISAGIEALCTEAHVEKKDICKVAIAGNTTMIHLLLGLSCHTLAQVPFTPVTLDMVFMHYSEIFEGDLSCEVAVLPGISTYVGADITAGLFLTELHTSKAPAILLDIGTNGEMALAHNGKILCTATAAGPAFEGGNILWGTGSVPGAISGVLYNDGKFEVKTIGDKAPVGICGTGVIETVHEGLKADLILSSGRFRKKEQPNDIFLAKAPDGRDIVFCQKDVRELQLGKSAIRSGLDALLNYAGLDYNDIETLYIAGGFGFNLNMESAAGVGLIPLPLVPKVSLIGNSALGGSVKYLLDPGTGVPDYEEVLGRIINLSEEFSLPEDKYFISHFIKNINFE